MRKIFLQFYREEEFLYGDKTMVNFCNGLSYVWDQVKNEGDMVWKEVDDETPIITEGTIYASAWYSKNIEVLYKWAKQFPKLEIYVCGPVVLHYDLLTGRELSNFHFIRGNAEDVFFNGVTDKWKIEIPKMNKPIGYNISLINGTGCYWGKCNYCKITGPLKYRDVDKVPVIDYDGDKYIWIHTFSMPPHLLKKLYPQLEDRNDVYYATYIRADKPSIKALKVVIPKLKVNTKYLGFDVGIEFPTDRMLQYMNKGSTVKDYLDFIKLTSDSGITLHFNLIIGWKYTNSDDVNNVEKFLNQLSKITKPNTITANLYPLTLVPDRKVMSEYTMEEMEPFKTDFDIFFGMPRLDEEHKKITEDLRSLYHSYPFQKLYDFVSKRNTWSKRIYGGPGLNSEKIVGENQWEK